MTSRGVTYAGFAVLVAIGIGLSVFTARRSDWTTLPQLLVRLTRSRVVRLLFVLAWAWVGWHLFARGSGAFE